MLSNKTCHSEEEGGVCVGVLEIVCIESSHIKAEWQKDLGTLLLMIMIVFCSGTLA